MLAAVGLSDQDQWSINDVRPAPKANAAASKSLKPKIHKSKTEDCGSLPPLQPTESNPAAHIASCKQVPIVRNLSNISCSSASQEGSVDPSSQEGFVDLGAPDYVFTPGSFDVVLLVDSHEIYG